MTDSVTLEERLDALEKRIAFLEKERPGRKMRPNITSQHGVCGLDPECDSKTCESASIYRYQQGCQGEKCVKINRDYYANYKKKNVTDH
jgi:hypothetical protein